MTTIEQLQVGDIILPPARELRLWMNRCCCERNLSDDAVQLTIREKYEGAPDIRGRWIVVKCDHTEEWNAGRPATSFNFKARPETVWPLIERTR